MRAWVTVCLLAACERAGDTQPIARESDPSTPRPSDRATEAPRAIDAGVAPLPIDAAIVVDVPAKPPRVHAADDDPWAVIAVEGDPHGDMSPRRPHLDLGEQVDAASRGRVTIVSKRVTNMNESTLSADLALGKIQSAYMAGIKRCYKKALETTATLKGRITLVFDVDASGRAVKPTVKGFEAIDDCVAKLIPSWRFSIPKDVDGEPTSTGFEFVLQLVPR